MCGCLRRSSGRTCRLRLACSAPLDGGWACVPARSHLTAATRAAMNAESTAVCDQQTALGAGRCSRGVLRGAQVPDRRGPPGSCVCAVRPGLPGASQMRAAPDPRAFTRVVWGLTHVLRFPAVGFPPVSRLPAGFSPFARLRLVSPSSGGLRFVPSAVARFRFPLGFPPGSLPLKRSPR
jgi:hypothetical protein